MTHSPRARIIWLFVFGSMLGWDGARFILALIENDQPMALLSGAGVILLVGIVIFLFTRAPRANGGRGR
jgi:hypothetical protein